MSADNHVVGGHFVAVERVFVAGRVVEPGGTFTEIPTDVEAAIARGLVRVAKDTSVPQKPKRPRSKK